MFIKPNLTMVRLLNPLIHSFNKLTLSELELTKQLKAFADQDKTLDQYAIRKFAEAFEVVPRTLAENSGKYVYMCMCV
jgi:hypothetical protein